MMTLFHHGSRLGFFLFIGLGLSLGQVNPAPAQTVEAKRMTVAHAALDEVGITTIYDPSYFKIDYPDGDVPLDRGVCTDVIIRALRKADIDLQVLVHEDKKKALEAYPADWGKVQLDSNIDHRRVPNLVTFFKRQGKEVAISKTATDYVTGDIVVWQLPSGQLHVGMVTDRTAPGTNRPLLVHNIGEGAQCEDVLFAFPIIGHYRWFI